MKWIKKGSKTVLNEFIGSVNAKIIADPTEYSTGKALWIRHDVEKDLDHAIKFAEYEYKNNIQATYFLLHTPPYFDSSKELKEKTMLLKDMGMRVCFYKDLLSLCYETFFTHKYSDSGENDLGTKVIEEFNEAEEGLFQMLLHPVDWEEVL